MHDDVKQLLLDSKVKAKEEAHLLQNRECLSLKYVEAHVRKYIYYKYLLTEEDACTDDINELAELSLSKSVKLDRSIVENIERNSTCNSASSATMKKVLLYMAIQKDLNIKLDAKKTALIQYIADLSALIFEELQKSV